jgi:acyl-CoA synthetase (AMP-forming)/AMP-acid ligase II
MKIIEMLSVDAKKYSDKPALIFAGQEISFSNLEIQVRKLAVILKNEGVSKGDKIAFFLPNCPEYVYAYLACFYLGAVGVPLDYMLKDDELISCLSHSESKILIALAHPIIDLNKVKDQVNSLKTILSIDGNIPDAVSYKELMINAGTDIVPEIVNDDEDPALIMYTSGTTGKPKGILLNYRHLEGSPAAMHHFVDLSDRDIKLAAIPFSHIGGFIYIQNCIHFGITLIIMPRFQPMEFLENVQKYKVTCFHIVPPMYTAILTLKHIDNFDLSSLRWAVVFGAPSSPDMLKRFHQYCPNANLLNGWGMTETCPPNTVTPMGSDNIASVGKPAPNCTIKILNDEGKEVQAGEIGEIVISGWIIMKEYYKDPDATSEVKKPEGLHTGDLGRFDEDGFLYIVGRKKEMIKVGGQIVYAPEVESVLYKNPVIAEAAVIGIPDKLRGEVVKAFVVLKEGQNSSPEDIRYFCREHLANFKVPHEIEIRSALAKNRTGKIDKSVLR